MRLFLFLLVASSTIGATPLGRRLVRRPAILFLACAVAGSLFYSYRFIR